MAKKTEAEEEEQEILVDLRHDPFLRHIVLSVHMGKKSEPAEFMAELRALVDDYGDCPEKLFNEEGTLLDEFH